MDKSSSKSNPGNWIVSTAILVVVGVGLGFALGQVGSDAPAQDLLKNISLGLVWAFILLQWVDIVGQAVALLSDPVGADLDLSNRDQVAQKAAGMKSSPEVLARSANLLQAWSGSLSPDATIDLAAFQSSRSRKSVLSGTVFGFLVLYALGLSATSTVFVWGAGVLLGLTLLAKLGLISRIDAYLEARVLSRLPGNLPNTAMTADELSGAIGQSIERAFDQYVPKPEAMAQAIQGGVQEASKAISEQGNAVASALQGVQSNLSGSFSGVGKEAAEQLAAALAAQSDRLEATSTSLVNQIEKLIQVEKNIDNLLDMQKSVDNALQGVSASQEFQNTLAALNAHLAESDKLLKEAAKPRMITLVEED